MNHTSLRRVSAIAFLCTAGLVAAGCTTGMGEGGASSQGAASSAVAPSPATTSSASPTQNQDPVTLTVWSPWTGRELKQFNAIFANFTAKYPWITVNSQGGIPEDKQIAGISSGKPPDVAISFGVDNVGKYCQSGAWQDLMPWITGPDGIDMTKTFPPSVLTYTSFNNVQCALPFLTDAFGIYMNDDQLKAAGITTPPKTLTELQADAKKLTQFDADGNITRAGFVPWFGYYCCALTSVNSGNMFGASWYTPDFKSAFDVDPKWGDLLKWQRQFVADVYGNGDLAAGTAKLKKFVAGAGDEFGCSQDFITGRVAISIDGEWRNAYMKDCQHDFNYTTAAWPVPDDQQDRYGSGSVGGTTIGIPKGAAHADAAWLLVKWMTTDTPTLVYMANNVNNVPTTYDALSSPDLTLPPQFTPFFEVFRNPNSAWRPTTPIGDADESAMGNLMDKWQNLSIQDPDLAAGLQDAATAVNNALDEVNGP